MKCIRKYTLVEYEYSNELEAELHSKSMKREGFTETTLSIPDQLRPKNKIIKTYKVRHRDGVFY